MDILNGYAEVNDTRLFYEIAGEGPTVVLIHGFGLDLRQWDNQFDVLTNHFQVVRYDLRGFGKSRPPTGVPYNHADDLKALLEHLSIQDAHILGHSFGGRVAITFAILYPEMVLSLIGPDPAVEGFQSDDPSTQAVFEELDKIWTTGRESGADAARELFLKYSPMESAMKIPAVASRIKQIMGDYSGWHWVNDDSYQPLDPPGAQQLDKIKSPSLILVGELNPACIHLACDFLAENIANCKKVEILGVAHMLNMEDPEQFNNEVVKFLQSF